MPILRLYHLISGIAAEFKLARSTQLFTRHRFHERPFSCRETVRVCHKPTNTESSGASPILLDAGTDPALGGRGFLSIAKARTRPPANRR
jgi:hypothetical protein